MNPAAQAARPHDLASTRLSSPTRLAAIMTAAALAGLGSAAEAAPRFTDVTAASGFFIAENTDVGGTNPHAVAIEDFNEDGRPDVIIPTFGAPFVRYFRNQGGLKFADVTRGSGLESFEGAGTGAAVADFDHDGHLDVYLTSLRKGACRLYQGRGDGTFRDVSEPAGVLLTSPGRSCAWSDIDGDGWVDLYVTCPDGPNRLFVNQRDGRFRETGAEAGVALADRHSLGCAFADVNEDGRDDLFVANYQSQHSALFLNQGGGKFRDVTAEAGLARKASAVGGVFGDIDNRGLFDLLVTTDSWLSGANSTEPQLLAQGHTVEPNALYLRQPGPATVFRPAPAPTLAYKSLSHDAVLEDLDHDGRVEIYVGVDATSGNAWATSKGGNPLWTRPAGSDVWSEAAGDWGVKYVGNCVCVPAVDFDDDGDLDLLLVNFYANVVLYRNEANDRRWLQIRAAGTRSSPDGVGAQIRVFDSGGKRLLGLRQIQSGAGYCRSSPLAAHFGLGQATGPFRVEAFFPGTQTRVMRSGVKPGTKLVLKEGKAAANDPGR